MGTRSRIAVQLDGEYKIAQYSQWDGYPEGQGSTVLEFLSNADIEVFKKKLRASKFFTENELENIEELHPDDWDKKYPQLSRNTGAKILFIVETAEEGIKLQNRINFAEDSLFCEYGYVIDLDTNQLEVYLGFNKSPLSEGDRFYGFKCDIDSEYTQIRKIASYSLNELPTLQKMIDDCNGKE